MAFLAKTAPLGQAEVSTAGTEVSTGFSLNEPSRIFLDVGTADIGSFSRVGNDLVFSVCGDVVTIAGFFLPEVTSELFLRGADGEAVKVLFESIGADGEIIARFLPQADAAPFESLTSAACIIAPESGSSLSSIGAAFAGVGLLGALADSSSSRGLMDPGLPEARPPAFVGAALAADGRVLTLRYDAALDAANPPPAGSFVILVNGAAVAVTAVRVVGGQVELTLATPVASGATVTVGYNDPTTGNDANAIQDAAGTDAASLPVTGVANGVPDTVPPSFLAAQTSADGAGMVLVYDQPLDAANPPLAASFAVTVNGAAVAVTGVGIAGNTVVLTLATPVPAGAAVTVAYADPTAANDASAVQDAQGNDAVALAPTPVSNLVPDGAAPAFVSAVTSANGAALVLTYSEALDAINAPTTGSFAVTVNGAVVAVTSVAIDGASVVLTLATPVAHGAVVTLAYADPSAGNDANAVQDAAGNDAASLPVTPVANAVPDTSAPAFVSATTSSDGATLTLGYSEALDAANPPAAGSFVVNVGGAPVAVSAVAVVGASVVLTLATPVPSGAAVTVAYADPGAGNDASAIQDAAGNDAASLPTTGVVNAVPDTGAPAFVSAATSGDGATLTLNYSEALDAANVPAPGSFVVDVDGTPVAVTGVVVSGSSVVLTLASAVGHGAAVTVAYADPTAGNDADAIQDAAGNDAVSLPATNVSNLVPDATPPAFVSAVTSADGATLVLSYDEALDAANPPAAGSFVVTVNGTPVGVTAVSIAGSTLVLALAAAVTSGAVVTVAYADPSVGNDAGAVQDVAGNDAASLAQTGVNNLVSDGTTPTFVSAATSADGAALVLTYDEALDAANPPASSSFLVNVDGVSVVVAAVSVAGSSVVLTLGTPVTNGAVVTVAYGDPTMANDAAAIQDTAGNDAASLLATRVGNQVPDTTPPAFVSATTSADGATLVLAYNEALDAGNLPAAGSFLVTVDGAPVAVTAVAAAGSVLVLTLASPAAHGAAITVAYGDPSAGNDGNAIQDAAGNDAASLAPTGVTNTVPDGTAPAFVSAVTSADGGALTLTYNEALDAANPPAAASFVVNVDGAPVAVTAVSVVGASVVLTLAAPVPHGVPVSVAYGDPSAGNDGAAIQDAAGNDAASLLATPVSNVVPDTTAPAFVSATTSADGATLVLNYDDLLDAANPPAAGSFLVNVNGAPVGVASVAVVGSTVVLTLAAPVPNAAAVTVAYGDPTTGNDAGAVQDAAGNDAASLAATAVTNAVPDTSAPVFVSAATNGDGTTLTLIYSEALDAAQLPVAGSFTVIVNGAPVPIAGLSVTGATVALTLGAAVSHGATVSVAYADPSAANDPAAVQDAAGNDAASLPLTAVSNLVPDTTAPVFVSAVTSADGSALVLTYGEALDAANLPAPGSFTVNVDGAAVGVTAVAVSGSTVRLTLATAVNQGAAVTVAYADPTAGNDGSAVQDAAGNDAASLPATAVGNLVPDGLTPTFVSATTSADGAALVLTYDEALDAANPPAAGGFVVNVDGVAVGVTAVAVVGATVVLTLATAVANGAVVTVAYNDPTAGNDANAIQDAAGNDAASLLPTSVANAVPDTSAPAFVSATTSADGATLVLNYNEALDAGNPPAAGSFVVNVNGAPVAVSLVGVFGSTAVLTLATPVAHGAAVTVAYVDPSAGNDGNAIQDAAGNDAASLAATGVTNNVPDTSAPSFVSAVTSSDGATLVLNYSEALDAGNAPLAGSFVVDVDGTSVAVTGVAIQGASVVLTLATPVPHGAAVSVAYGDPTTGNDGAAIQDAAGNDAASLPPTLVGNAVPDSVAPVFVSAATSADGVSVVLTYDEALDAANTPAASGFVVNVGGASVGITGVAIVGASVVLTLATPVANGAAVTVAYADPTPGNDGSAIQDASGNDALSLAPTAVTNTVPDTLAPTFVSAATRADGAALVLAYDEPLDGLNLPAAGLFTVNVNGAAVAVTGVSAVGSTLVLALASAVTHGAAVTVAYADPTPGNDAGAVQDASGNDAASLGATGVVNTVPDTAAPVFLSAATSADGATLTLAYSEPLDAGNPPAPGSFTVTVNGAAVAVTAAAVVASSVVLTLASPVANGAVVTVAYDDPTGGNDGAAVQDAAGNDAASLAATGVGNLVPDTSAPSFVSAVTSADGATLVLNYSEALDAANAPAPGSFTVASNGVAIAVSAVTIIGSTVVLALATPVANGAVVSVAYDDPSTANDGNAIQDTAGNDAASLPATGVVNAVPDTTAPVFVSAATSADGTALTLGYSEALDAANPPAAGSFTVTVNGAVVEVTGVAVSGSSVVLTLVTPVASGAAVTVAYADATTGDDAAAVQDAAGNDAASLPATNVSNLVPDASAPTFVSAATSADGATLVLTYDDQLDAANPPPPGSFVVTIDGAPATVTAVGVAGATVLLTLATPVTIGAVLTVSYDDPTPGNDSAAIQNTAGIDAASLAGTPVTNLVPNGVTPNFVAAATSTDGNEVVMFYDTVLDSGNMPWPELFVVRANGFRIAVARTAVFDSTIVLTMASPIPNGASVTVAYDDPSAADDLAATQDTAGNDAASLPVTSVSNRVADTVPPAFVSAGTAADGSALLLTYSEPLDPANPPAAGSFVVTVDGAVVAVTGVAVSGNGVALTLATPVAHGATVTVGYTDPSAGNDAAAIQDTAGNDAASLAPIGVNNTVPDTGAPVFVSAVTRADGDALVLTYDEALDIANPPLAGGFVVTVNGVVVAVTGVAITGASVELTLASPVGNGATVTVAYSDPTAGNDAAAIQDAAGNDAASLAPTSVNNTVPDTLAPAFVSAVTSADGTRVVLTYDEALDPANPPLAGSFVVNANGAAVTVAAVALSGNAVVLTLASPVANGAALTVAYGDPTPGDDASAVQDRAGNDAASLAETTVTNAVPDTSVPSLQISAADLQLASGETTAVTFRFSEAVTGFGLEDVMLAGGTLSGFTQIGATTWTASFTQDGSSTQPSISVASGTFTDLALNPGTGFALDAAQGLTADITPPTLQITAADLQLASGEATAITFSFSEPVTGFTLEDVAVQGGALAGFTQRDATTWTAVFTQDGTSTPPSVSVAAGSYADIASNPGVAYALDASTGLGADISAPQLQSVSTNASGLEITLVYNEALDAARPPVAGSFEVRINGVLTTVSTVAVSGSSVVLGLATPVVFGDSVTLSYADPSAADDASATQDTAGNDAASLAAQPVTNTVPSTDITAPTLVITAADLLLARGEATLVTFEFSEAVQGFDAADVVLAGGALSAFTQIDANTWTAVFTQDGTATPPSIGVANGAFTDASSNQGIGYVLDAGTGLTTDLAQPTLLITAADLALASGEATTLAFTFSEPVAGFALEDVAVQGGALTGFTQIDASTWTAVFTQDGTATPPSVSVATGAYADIASNPGAGYTLDASTGLSADISQPTLVITAADLALASGEATTITFTFSEPVAGFALEDVAVQGGALTGFTQIDASTWTAVFTQDGTATPPSVSVATGVYADIASNPGSSYTLDASTGLSADISQPMLVITAADLALASGEATAITFTFSEPVAGFALEDVAVQGGALSGFTQIDASTWTAVFTQDGTTTPPSVSVATGAYADIASNPGSGYTLDASTGLSADISQPTLVITAADLALASGEATTLAFTFSEPVAGFALEDVAVQGGALTGFTQIDASTWTAVFTQDGTATAPSVSVAAGAYTDIASNPGAAYALDAGAGFTADVAAPQLQSVSTNAAGLEITLVYNEALDAARPPVAGSFEVRINGVLTTVSTVAVAGNSVVLGLATPVVFGDSVTLAYTDPGAGDDANATQDLAGNDAASLAAQPVANVVPSTDTTAPTLVITAADPLLARGEATLVTFEFSEAVQGFADTDVVLAGGALSAFTQIDANTWTAVFTQDGTATPPSIGVDNGAFTDASSNPGIGYVLDGSTGLVADVIQPTLLISASDLALASGEATTITFAFSEAVTGFAQSDVAVQGGALSGFTQLDATTWTAVFTQDGTATAPGVSVAAGAYTDIASNSGAGYSLDASTGLTVDISQPTLLITASDLRLANGEAAAITFTFSEPVAGFALEDVAVQGGALSGFTQVNASTWTAVFTQDGTATAPSVSVAAGAYTDIASNPGAAYALDAGTGFTADVAAPQLQSISTNAAGLEITLVYDEALDAARPPVAGSFEVRINGVLTTVSTVAVAGNSVVLGLATPVVFGDSVTLAYADPSAADDASATQDTAGNDAATLAAQPVTNAVPSTDTTAPTLAITAADLRLSDGEATDITFEFSESVLDFDASDVVLAGGALSAFTQVDSNTWTAVFTQDGTAAAPSIGVASGAFTDAAQNQGVGYVLDAGTGLTADITAPTLVSAATSADGATLVLGYSEALDQGNLPTPGAFVVDVDGVVVGVNSVTVNGSSVILALATAVGNGAAVSVAYTDPSSGNDVNAVQDAAGNDAPSLPATAATNLVPDTQAPVLMIGAADLQLASGETTEVTFTFSEAVTGFGVEDVVTLGGTLTAFTQRDATTWTASFTQDGTATPPSIGVVSGSFTDLALNPGTGYTLDAAQGLSADISQPTLLITAADPALANGQATSITFTFSEPVAGFALEDVVVQGGALSDFTQLDATTWTAVFTQDTTATPPSVAVAAGTYADIASNPGAGYTLDAGTGLTADITAPGLTITAADLALALGEATAITFSFSEPVTGFALGDVVVQGGTLSGFAQRDAATWTAVFTQDGTATPPSVSVATGTYADIASNPGTGYVLDGSTGLTADITPPTLLITSADLQLASGEATAITFRFSEPVAGFAQEDVTVQGGALTGFTQVNASTWTAVFTQDGTSTPPSVSVAAGTYTDIAANPGGAYALDASTGLSADIAAPQLQSVSTNASGLLITLVYDEVLDAARAPVAGNFEVRVNGVPAAVSTVAVSGSSVVLGLANAVVFGDSVTLSYADPSAANDANATQDTAGNDAASLVAQPVANIVPSTDTTAPTLEITAADLLLASGESTLVTFEFSEAVLGFAADDVVVAGGLLSAFTQVDANTWTAVFTQDATAATPSIGVADGSFTDMSLNQGVGYVLNGAAGFVADITPPVLLSAQAGAGGATLVLSYSEALDAVNAPLPGSFVVNAGGAPVAVSSLTVTGNTVVLTLAAALANGATVTVGYNDPTAGNDARAVQDLAGNDATSSAGVVVPDTRPPVLQGASVTDTTLTLTFDEALGAAPPVGSFVVNANGTPVAVSAAVVSGSSVVLTLASAVAAGAVVTVGYTDPTAGNDASAIQDVAGNDAASIAPAAVANTRALIQVDEDDITGTGPAVASGAFAGVAANAALTLAPPAGLTSGGQAIVWTGAGTATLTGHVGSATGAVAVVVSIASGGASAGQYTVSLFQPLDHTVANAEDLRNFNVGVLLNGAASNLQLTVGVVDDVPVAAPTTTQVITAAGSLQGNAALTFGADGGYVQSVNVDGLQFSYNPAARTVAQTGTSTSVFAYSYDNQSTLTVTTLRGETFSIDLSNGQYSLLATGVRASVPVNVAPVAGLGESGAVLGLVSLNALGLIDVSTQQAFTASDANNNIREVLLTLGGVSVGGLLRNPFVFSAPLAAELGLRAELISVLLSPPRLRITSLTTGQPIDNLKLNELLGTVRLDTSLLGALSLDLLSSLSMTVTDTAGLTDTATTADLLNVQLLQSLIGAQAPGFEGGTTGADVLDGADGLAADASRRLYGYAGNDTLLGNLGNDILRGGAGNDTLSGLAGNDILIGGAGADTLAGGQGVDVFRWEAGDQGAPGAPVVDTITDFNVNSVWAGGDVLHLGGLLVGEGRIGFTSGNLTNYLHFAKVGNDTLISISSQGGYVGGFNAANAGTTDQQILLKNVDLVTGLGGDAAIITRLLGQGKLDVDSAALNGGALDGTTDVGFGLIDRDGDTAAGSVTFDTSAVTPATFNPNNRAPEVQVASSSLLGLIGLDALNAINLSAQDFSVIDRDRNLSQVEVRFQPVLSLSLTPLQLTASQNLAAELGLQLRVRNDPGLLNLLAPSSTLIITSLIAGAAISNQSINELLASVHLTDQAGTLLNGALLSANVLNALTITATDAQGASSTASVGQLLDANLADNVNDSSNVIEGTNAGETLIGTTGADRLYGFGGDDTLLGGDGDDLLRGGSGNDTLNGGNGDDLLIGGDGNDTFVGGAGNDTIELLSPNYASISGGTGFDTLLLDGGISLNLTTPTPTRISSIERIDLGTGDTGSVLTLTAQAVLELTDSPSHTLQIVGDARDSVVMSGATRGATTVVGDVSFVSYAWSGATVLVEQEITNVVV